MKRINISKKIWITLSALAVIGAILAYYLWVYVEDRESKIMAEQFRILKQCEKSVLDIKKDYDKRIANYSENYSYELKEKDEEVIALFQKLYSLQDQLDKVETEYWDVYDENEINPTTKNELKEIETSANNIEKEVEDLEKKIEKEVEKKKKEWESVARTLVSNLKKIDLEFTPKDSIDKYKDIESIYFKVGLEGYSEEYHQQVTGYLRTPLSSFLKRSNFTHTRFDEFLLIRVLQRDNNTSREIKANTDYYASTDYYPNSYENPDKKCDCNVNINCCEKKSKNKNDSIVSAIAYQTFANRVEFNQTHFDSLFFEDRGLRSIPVYDIRLAGTHFKMFSHRMKFNQAEGEDWILCGLVKASNFKQASRKIETWKLVFAFLAVVFILLAMPILKLLIMSAIERLRIMNVWSTGFSITLGTALLVLILLAANDMVGYKGVLDKNLEKLSEGIKKDFTNELLQINRQLNLSKSINKVPDTFKLRSNYYDSIGDSKKKTEFPFYTNFRDLLWVKGDGTQILRIATYNQEPMSIPLKLDGRKYFSRANHDSLWVWHNGNDKAKFTLESIRSWVSGNHEAGIGIKLEPGHEPATVLAMATKLSSVIDPTLPPGYGFCIMDGDGKVWFHSESKRNLQENFIDEVNRDDKILAVVKGRQGKSIETEYNNKNHRIFIQPIDESPLYLVTFFDMEYSSAPIVQSVYFTFLLITFLFLLQGLQLFFLFVSVYKPTKLKIRRFFLKWLRPRKNECKYQIEGTASMMPSEKYVRSIVVQLVLIAVLIVLIVFVPHERAISFIFLILPVYFLVFQYLLLEREETLRERKKLWHHPFVWLSVGLIILINIFLYRYINWIAFVAQFLMVSMLFYAYTINNPFKKWKKLKFRSKTKLTMIERLTQNYFGKLYFFMMLLWLVLTSVLPVFYFYRSVSFHEQLTWKKYLVWEIARQDAERNEYRREALQADIPNQTFGNYIGATDEYNTNPDLTKFDSLKKDFVHDFRFDAALSFFGVINNARAMLTEKAYDKKWDWKYNKENDGCVLATFFDINGNARSYSGHLFIHSFFESDYAILFLLLFIMFGVLIIYTANFTTRSIFGLGLVTDEKFIEYAREEVSDEQLIKILSLAEAKDENQKQLTTNSSTSGRVFLVGLPYSGKTKLLEGVKNLSRGNISMKYVDFRSDLKKRFVPKENELVYVRHFEYGINDHEFNKLKIEMLQRIVKSSSRILISSTVQPVAILEFYDAALQRIDPHENADARKEWTEYKHAIRIWKNLLSGFIVLYQPLSRKDFYSPRVTRSFAESELLHGVFLRRAYNLFKNEPCKTYEEKENFVLRVEEFADTYYHSLWNSFSNSEKYLLYDLAKDRFVNLKNLTTIRILMQKGVILVDDTLTVMNRSFNNFILSVVKEDEELRMERELRQKGSWSTVRTVIVIALIGLATFIALAQQNLMQNFNLLLGAVGSIAALLTRFGGLFGSANKVRE